MLRTSLFVGVRIDGAAVGASVGRGLWHYSGNPDGRQKVGLLSVAHRRVRCDVAGHADRGNGCPRVLGASPP